MSRAFAYRSQKVEGFVDPSASPASAGLVLSFLGVARVQVANVAVEGRLYDRGKALLAYLAVERARGPFARSDLAELLWPWASPHTSRGNLRRALHDLRFVLCCPAFEGDPFVATRNAIGWNPSIRCDLDVDAFLASPDDRAPADDPVGGAHPAERVLALWRGDFLSGLSLAESSAFEDWVGGFRARLRQRRVDLLGRLAGRLMSQGRAAEAIPWIEQELSLDPHSEEACQRLMQALLKVGRGSAALACFKAFRQGLRRELGVEPTRATCAIAEAIRGRESHAVAPAPGGIVATQRRQVVVFVCEFSAPPEDPSEHTAEQIAEAFGALFEIVRAHRGECLALDGRRALVHFPDARDAERTPIHALDAALEVLRAPRLGPPLRLRIGAHCGWALHDRRFQLPDLTGAVPRRAAELTIQVGWGHAAVSAELARLVEGFFAIEAVDSVVRHEASKCFRLVGRTRANDWMDAKAARLTPFVGREVPLRQLRADWRRVARGLAGAARLIVADAGVGKSRLLHEHRKRVQALGGRCHVLNCQAELQATPLHPVVEHLGRALEVDSPGRVRLQPPALVASVHLDRWLASLGPVVQPHRQPLAELLGMSLQGSEEPTAPEPAKRHRHREALNAVLQAWCQSGPCLLVIEDLHWADPSTLEWVVGLFRRPPPGLQLLASAREEFGAPPELKPMHLPPMPQAEAIRLIRGCTGESEIPSGQLAHILGRAEGIPLFLEEIAMAVRHGGDDELPITLRHLLASRLERAGPGKRVAQQAAVIGREFSLDLLAAVWEGSSAELEEAMAEVCRAGLLHRSGERGSFRHALIQDAALETLTTRERRRIHGRVARLYEGRFADRVAFSPERLARHQFQAGEPLDAARTWLRAGRLAAERSAHREAAVHFGFGIEAIRDLPAAMAVELSLQAALGATLIVLRGYGSTEAKACFARALELSRIVPDDGERFPVIWGIWLGGRSCTPEAYPLELTHQLERAARLSGREDHRMQAHYAYGNNLFWLARHDEAMGHLQDGLKIGSLLSPSDLIREYGEDTYVSCLGFAAWIHWLQGRPITASRTAQSALERARSYGHVHTICFALTFSGALARWNGDPEAAHSIGRELHALAARNELTFWQASGDGLCGWAMAATGDVLGLERTQRCLEVVRTVMSATNATFASPHIDALWRLGQYAACACAADDAIARGERQPDVHLAAEFLRLRGLALARQDPTDPQALACLRRAWQTALDQEVWTLAERAGVVLRESPSLSPTERANVDRQLLSIRTRCPELGP